MSGWISQWGRERTFVAATAEIRVVPHVQTEPFHPITDGSMIDDLTLIDARGQREDTERLFSEVRNAHIGQPYSKWAGVLASP